ncbi:MAG: hypothetical protein EXX96DRAFT_589274 [Benjaminiella poitrasii]|nr:MAG: hypothetical protein EXX96DRAFT_589274 [Benjaminiella poitrasii]
MIQACSSTLTLDPIFIIPMTRKERRRVLRWRLNWLPGRKQQCHCGGETSRYHLLTCPAIPPSLWQHIPIHQAPHQIHPIDRIIQQLPLKKPITAEDKLLLMQKWNPIWTDLLTILFHLDEICIQTQQRFEPETDIGELLYNWIQS